MDVVFISRQAEENSVLTNIAMALEATKGGQSAAVLFTEDALAAVGGKSFSWAQLLKGRDARIQISRTAGQMGLPLASEGDARWTDVRRLIREAKKSGVTLWADPMWARLLGLDGGNAPAKAEGGRAARPGERPFVSGKVPPEVTVLREGQALKELQAAKTVIGGF